MREKQGKKLFAWMARTERQNVSAAITQVYVELSTHCTLSCRTCVRHSIEEFRPGHFTTSLMKRLSPMLKTLPHLRRIVLLGFGEALCNPDFAFHLRELRTCGAELVLVSNAQFLDHETAVFLTRLPVDELWLSWDDDPASAPRNRRGASSAAFMEKIKLITEIRSAAKNNAPHLGMEIVAMKSNHEAIPSIITFGRKAGIDRFIISNIFPYSDAMKDEILYSYFSKPVVDLRKKLKGTGVSPSIRIAGQNADIHRSCPFIEAGTAFITAGGNIAPCPELAYTHPAWYFGSGRMHRRKHFGNILSNTLSGTWESREFSDFRNRFNYFEFPDCSACSSPDLCWHRTVDEKDCYWNDTPCGECLWAKNIILCP